MHPPITLNLKTGTRAFDYQSNEPSPKFIRSPFLCKPYMPPEHSLQPFTLRLWGVVSLKDIISGPFNYVEQNWLSQNFDWMCLGKWCAWEGCSLPSKHF